ncbi:hypothetical protein [Rhizobium leguminosarum]|uniref:hypothetical protein n=1 Tax=Rhizobium leguminosarum TaxID=384 RepID=UPI0014423AA0|nr:hypothetical protein [Rhizobium leguminosarum]
MDVTTADNGWATTSGWDGHESYTCHDLSGQRRGSMRRPDLLPPPAFLYPGGAGA